MKTKILFAVCFSLFCIELFSWAWPLSNSSSQDTFTSAFGPRLLNGSYNFHRGMDLQASENTDVYAAYSGDLIVAENQGGDTGGIVSISDGTYKTVYMHLNSWTNLVPGSPISEGDWIATSGGTGAGASPNEHLHFEYRDGTNDAKHPLQVMPYNDYWYCAAEMITTNNQDFSFKLTVDDDELDIDEFDLFFVYIKDN